MLSKAVKSVYTKTYKKICMNIHKPLDFFGERRYNLSHKYAEDANEEEIL